MTKNKESDIVNIPNGLTLLRILLVPLFLYFIIEENHLMGLFIFIIAGATDSLDGFIAKHFNRETALGATLDPIADKFLLTSAFIILTYQGILPLWLCLMVLLRDIIILGIIIGLRSVGRTVTIKPALAGKITTCLQLACVIYSLFILPSTGTPIYHYLVYATAFFTLYSGYVYIMREIKDQAGKGTPIIFTGAKTKEKIERGDGDEE